MAESAAFRYEVYVTPFQGSGGRWQLSTSGGIYPRWRADGKELFYIAPDNRMMAVPIDVVGTTLRPGTAVSLFPTDLATGGNVGIAVRRRYRTGLENFFKLYEPIASTWRLYDGSGPEPNLVADRLESQPIRAYDETIWRTAQQSENV